MFTDYPENIAHLYTRGYFKKKTKKKVNKKKSNDFDMFFLFLLGAFFMYSILTILEG